MKEKGLVMAGAVAAPILVACSLLPIGGARRAPGEGGESATSGNESEKSGLGPLAAIGSVAGGGDCPRDLAVKTDDRTINTRLSAPTDPDRYKGIEWAPGHKRAPAQDFVLAEQETIDRVIAIEAKNPAIVPAGFRKQLRADPRDKALRLRMARCELDAPATRRRASYDAAMALLLGSPLDQVAEVLNQSTKYGEGDRTTASCSGFPCADGMTCEPSQKICLKQEAIAFTFVSERELATEEALSRGLFARYLKGERGWDSPLGWFLTERAHKCGAQICRFRAYSQGDSVELVRWDIRDGGTVETYACKRTPAMMKSVASQERCRSKTGSWSQELCLSMCKIHGQGEGCRVGCYQHCDTEATLNYECITTQDRAR